MTNLLRWLKRYGPAEIVGTLTALTSVLIVSLAGGGYAAVALVAPWAENLGYYGTLLVREQRAERSVRTRSRFGASVASLRNLALEFGPAELLDSLFVRPLLFYVCQRLVGSSTGGVVLGKLAADAVFYGPVILAYETRRLIESHRQART